MPPAPKALEMSVKLIDAQAGESGGEYFAVSFDNEDPSNDEFELSDDEDPYLIVQETLKNSAPSILDHAKSITWSLIQLHFRLFSVCP